MADEFWKRVYDRLIDNIELLKLICFDTPNADLIAWAKPNSKLWPRVIRFVRKGYITDFEGFIGEMLTYALSDNPLRRIILLNWVDKNKISMDFFKEPGNRASIERLEKGDFGNIAKIRILSMIDPREGASKLYKDILEKAEKEELPMASSSFGEISSAELQAAISAKDIIRQPDTPSDSQIGNFNDVVMEELAKIKAALEILQHANKELKSENKNLREQENKRQKEVAGYSNKLENSVNDLKKVVSDLAKEKELNASLSSQLAAAKKELASKPVPTISQSEINDLRHRLDESLKENQELVKALNNREASLSRIKAENEEINQKLIGFSDQNNLIASLKKRLGDLEKEKSADRKFVVGQILVKTIFGSEDSEKVGKKCWLFLALTGEIYYLDLSFVPISLAVPEEFFLVTFEEGKAVSIQSLETERKELYGLIKKEGGRVFLACDEEGEVSINLEVPEKWFNRPGRGVFLPELDGRKAGIYKLDVLPETANLKKNTTKIKKSYKTESTSKTDVEIRYAGQKVAVFGGDRVGIEYEKALSKIGLEAKWFSGFGLLSEISLGGFGRPELMIIVTKQLSHALLRELNAYALKNSIKVAYSTRRGVSAILELVAAKLQP